MTDRAIPPPCPAGRPAPGQLYRQRPATSTRRRAVSRLDRLRAPPLGDLRSLPPTVLAASLRAPARIRGMSPLARFFLPPLSLRALRSAASFALPSISARCFSAWQVVLDGRELDGPLPRYCSNCRRSRLAPSDVSRNGIHGLEQVGVLDAIAPPRQPASRSTTDLCRSRSRLLVGSSSSRKSGSAKTSAARRIRDLPARQRSTPCRDQDRTRHGASRGREPRFQRPVDVGDFVGECIAPLGTAKQLQRCARAEQIDHRGARRKLDVLAEHSHGSAHEDASRLGNVLSGDRSKQRCLADAVAADEPPVRAPNVSLRSERRGRPSGVDSERLDRMIDEAWNSP